MPIKKVEVSITTTSVARPWEGGPPIAPPKITLDGNPFPSPSSPAMTTAGFQVVVLDAYKDITKPENILLNKYFLISPDSPAHQWTNTYQRDWTAAVRAILMSGDVNAQIVFFTTYGIDANMAPTNEAVQMLFELGAGKKLQYWGNHSIPGKQEPGTWIADPANYVLIGYSSYQYGQGHEAYDSPGGGATATTTLTATLNNIVP